MSFSPHSQHPNLFTFSKKISKNFFIFSSFSVSWRQSSSDSTT